MNDSNLCVNPKIIINIFEIVNSLVKILSPISILSKSSHCMLIASTTNT